MTLYSNSIKRASLYNHIESQWARVHLGIAWISHYYVCYQLRTIKYIQFNSIQFIIYSRGGGNGLDMTTPSLNVYLTLVATI